MVSESFIGGLTGGATVAITIKAIDKFSKTFNKANVGIAGLAGSATLAIGAVGALGAATVGFGVSVAKTAAEAEEAFTGVRKTVELSEEEFAKLEKSFQNLSEEIPFSFNELSRIGEIAGQLGVEGVKNIEKFTKTVADIAVSTNVSSEQAATSFARISNILQEPISDVDKLGSAIVALGNNFATTESEILDFTTRIAGAGAVAGLSSSDLAGIATAFTSVGVRAEAGGTAVQKVLIEMNTAIATSNEKLELFAQVSGMSAEEFAAAFRQKPGEAFAAFVSGLGKQGDNAVTVLDNLGIADQRLVRGFLSVANAGDLVNKAIKTSNEEYKKNSALTAEANKFYKTTNSLLKTLKNAWENIKKEIGDSLLPVIKDMIEIIKTDLLPIIRESTEEIGESFADALKMAIKFVSDFGPQLLDLAIRVLPAVTFALKGLGYIIMGVAQAIEQMIKLVDLLTFGMLKLDSSFKSISSNKFVGDMSKKTEAIKSFNEELDNTVGISKDLRNEEKKNSRSSSRNSKRDNSKPIISPTIYLGRGSNDNAKAITRPTIYLGNQPRTPGPDGIIHLNDFILSKGQLYQTHPNDIIMGSKNGKGMGTTIIVNGNIQGVDPDDMLQAFQERLSDLVSL